MASRSQLRNREPTQVHDLDDLEPRPPRSTTRLQSRCSESSPPRTTERPRSSCRSSDPKGNGRSPFTPSRTPAGTFQRKIGDHLQLRQTPTLRFELDTSQDKITRIESPHRKNPPRADRRRRRRLNSSRRGRERRFCAPDPHDPSGRTAGGRLRSAVLGTRRPERRLLAFGAPPFLVPIEGLVRFVEQLLDTLVFPESARSDADRDGNSLGREIDVGKVVLVDHLPQFDGGLIGRLGIRLGKDDDELISAVAAEDNRPLEASR